jgi:outer membrane protein
LDAVFRGYEKFKVINKEFQAAVMSRQGELMKLKSEGEEEDQMLSKLTPGTADFKKHEDRLTELKARAAAGREQAQREFQLRDSENLATIYKEAQLMVTAIAQWRKMNYVVRVTNVQPTGTDPNTVMAAIQNTVIYADPRNDITNDVIYNLNRRYKAIEPAAPASGGTNANADGNVNIKTPAAGAAPAGATGRPASPARADQN